MLELHRFAFWRHFNREHSQLRIQSLISRKYKWTVTTASNVRIKIRISTRYVGRRYTTRPGAPAIVSCKHDQKSTISECTRISNVMKIGRKSVPAGWWLDLSRRSHVHRILFLFLAERKPPSQWTSVDMCHCVSNIVMYKYHSVVTAVITIYSLCITACTAAMCRRRYLSSGACKNRKEQSSSFELNLRDTVHCPRQLLLLLLYSYSDFW